MLQAQSEQDLLLASGGPLTPHPVPSSQPRAFGRRLAGQQEEFRTPSTPEGWPTCGGDRSPGRTRPAARLLGPGQRPGSTRWTGASMRGLLEAPADADSKGLAHASPQGAWARAPRQLSREPAHPSRRGRRLAVWSARPLVTRQSPRNPHARLRAHRHVSGLFIVNQR